MNPGTNLNASVAAAPHKRRLAIAIVLGSMTAIGPLSIDMYLPSLPMLAADLQANYLLDPAQPDRVPAWPGARPIGHGAAQ